MDRLDRAILRELQRNCRLPISKLAKIMGRPRTTISERIARLEREGIIKGYRAILDPSKLGYRFLAFVMLKVKRGVTFEGLSNQEALAKRIIDETFKALDLPYVEEVHIVTGTYDIILKVWARRWEELTNFLIRYLAGLGDIVSSETFLVLETMTSEKGFPIREDSIKA